MRDLKTPSRPHGPATPSAMGTEISRRAVLAAPLFALARPAAADVMTLHGGKITLEIEGTTSKALAALIPHWVEKSADAVAQYYGKFPVPAVRISVSLREGADVDGGRTFPGRVPHIEVEVGRDAGDDALMSSDWVMVHEMIHLAFPDLDGEHSWMHEGIAVYVESIARVQAGHLPAEQIWGDFVHQMPRGLPQDGDGGFDQGGRHSRTYWGGAMFCLMCDVEIRKRTNNAKGLQHALRGINVERDFRKEWDFRETLEVGDKATGTTVLIEFYDRMKETPEKPDLAAIWKELGVVAEGRKISFDGKAELASIRQALTVPLA